MRFGLAIVAITALAWGDGPPAVAADAVVDAAGFGRALAPGSLVSIFGTGLARRTAIAETLPLPTSMEGVAVELDDGAQVRPAPLLAVSPTQINAQIPYSLAPGAVALRVRNEDGVSGPQDLTLQAAAPALFRGAGGAPLIFHADFRQVTADAPAEAGETVIAYANGLGAVEPGIEAGMPAGDGVAAPLNVVAAPVEVTVAGQTVAAWAGLAPGNVGVYQLNFAVPDVDTGSQPVIVAAGGNASQHGTALEVVNRNVPRDFYAAPDGSAAGDGSRESPWDLKTALSGKGVRPGDRIWLRGGTYGDGGTIFESRLNGTAGRPIVVRQQAGERATINGGLAVHGPHTWFWGFEVTNTGVDRGAARDVPQCVNTYQGSTGVKLINLVLHDCNQGIGFWMPAENGEAYGNLIYHNGYQGTDRGHGHGIYTQNRTGTKTIAENIVFNQFGVGLHAYGSSNAWVEGYDVRGNVLFNNGIISTGATNVDNILFAIGGPMSRIRIEDNYTYHSPDGNKGYSRLGWQFSTDANKDVVVRGNYWIGGLSAVEMWNWDTAEFTGNTCYSKSALCAILSVLPAQNPKTYSWDRNTWYAGRFRFGGQNQSWDSWRTLTGLDAGSTYVAGAPTGVWQFVRSNKYEPGRAHIVVYNWDRREQVQVDVSAALKPGTAYEVRDAQNFFGPPVARGTYGGGRIAIPMGGEMAAPVGTVPSPPRHTGPEFGVFVLLPR